jgi:hypothetical protein
MMHLKGRGEWENVHRIHELAGDEEPLPLGVINPQTLN